MTCLYCGKSTGARRSFEHAHCVALERGDRDPRPWRWRDGPVQAVLVALARLLPDRDRRGLTRQERG